MSDKKPTQAMPAHGPKGAPDGVNTQAECPATDGSDQGSAYPNPHTGKSGGERENFANGPLSHGGQSDMAYHGSGQLGKQKVKPGGNRNAGSRDE